MKMTEIQSELVRLSGNNPHFYEMLTPGAKPISGVRVPMLRKLAKQIAREDYRSFLEENPLDTFEMEMLQAFVIGYAKDDPGRILSYFCEFIPKVHDWAVSDALCQSFKLARKYPKEVWDALMQFSTSKQEFEVRIVAVTLMSHFLNDDYINEVVAALDGLYMDDYYAKMGVAWAVATIMAKYPSEGMHYLKSNHLDDWTYNKSIQKMLESYRIPDATKKVLRMMKRK